MKRREFIGGTAGLLLATQLGARAEDTAPIPCGVLGCSR